MDCGSSTNTVSPAKDSNSSHTDIKIHPHRYRQTLENVEQNEQHAQIEDLSKYEQWATEKWPKVRGVFTDIDSICDSLRQAARECDDDDMKITGQIEPSFMYSMLFKEIVLEIHFDLEKEIPALAEYARQVYKDKPEQLPIIDEFVQQYNGNINNSPVRWYTAECFTYKMLNKALGRLDVATLLKTGFFMRDLHRNIEELHKKQINDNDAPFPKIVFRGEAMTQEDFDSKVQQALPPNHSLLATSYNNIGGVYTNMGNYSKALEFYEKAHKIKEKALPSNHPDLANSYNNIGQMYNNMGDYSKALEFYEKALEIGEKALPPNHPDLAYSYNNIAEVYYQMGDYSKALEFYEKALSSNHPSLAYSYNNIGMAYSGKGDYSKALSFLENALAIRQKSLPSTHPLIQETKDNIDYVKKKM
ncbi:unnamed protein product [Rotaria sp. Silwood1]|nr:unnamed protein product [Rotaria sp. Silwood1]